MTVDENDDEYNLHYAIGGDLKSRPGWLNKKRKYEKETIEYYDFKSGRFYVGFRLYMVPDGKTNRLPRSN